ncbi:MAG: bifunctional phosphoglucose/phosphomannose isomerase [Dehalococcoidia bacterium]
MVDLDNASIYSEFDKSGMLRHLQGFPEQCMRAWQKVMALKLPGDYSRIFGVVILGMGGSAIGGDIVQRLASLESSVPVWVHRDYGLPAFVDESTLVIASSYSGNTEETLSAFRQSLKTPARKLVITSGGELNRLAEAEGIPTYFIEYKAPPRAAFPHSFVPLLGIFQKLGLIEDKAADVREAVQILTDMTGDIVETQPRSSNPAKQLAARLQGRVAIIYGAEVMSEVARRWKAQFNENGKNWAFCETIPELNHNAVIGYSLPADMKQKAFVIMLGSRSMGSRNALRYRATAELLTRAGIAHETVESRGESVLAQIMGLVLLGDYCSFYLAMLNEVDPTTIDAIDFVKQYLARHDVSTG